MYFVVQAVIMSQTFVGSNISAATLTVRPEIRQSNRSVCFLVCCWVNVTTWSWNVEENDKEKKVKSAVVLANCPVYCITKWQGLQSGHRQCPNQSPWVKEQMFPAKCCKNQMALLMFFFFFFIGTVNKYVLHCHCAEETTCLSWLS